VIDVEFWAVVTLNCRSGGKADVSQQDDV
jgi:hypothetical protein